MPITLDEARRRGMWAIETTYPSGRVGANAYTSTEAAALSAIAAASKAPGTTMRAILARDHVPVPAAVDAAPSSFVVNNDGRIGRISFQEDREGETFFNVEYAGGDPECAELLEGEFERLEGIAAVNAQARFVLEDMVEHLREEDPELGQAVENALALARGQDELEEEIIGLLGRAVFLLDDDDFRSASGQSAHELAEIAHEALAASGDEPRLA